ncbi:MULTISPECIES: AIPR family protein [Nitrosomonas]|uniref:Possible abortive infection phage resistance protein n=1 Tax=Nitrosomonas europaea (strain ATCC 19718 / CIP 103999 / KCTC 2705 / NBRC 14298) TaxID=228410 RepID=Q82X11_NITEU|nr:MULTISPECIES: AIPR family protein [Nitrosomonas]CAD84400.1 possible abortive infection phage resistance protein [Nitrosomonas europaea ATCC 19718]SDW77575.1 AIPR protein [Nitrosomonas europaea]SES98094.1 AIPR protein [Nitrosomonas europaea]SJZ48556.1 AIPR protein [Nitrosomonas europaea]HBF24635.1 abortive phage resistance protein [Nitrosomonas sp.]
MNINASIIDQRLAGVQDKIKERATEEFGISDGDRLRSLAFVYLCVETMLDLDVDEAFDCLTDGGGDFGVDALHITEEMDGEFGVTLFQGKYKKNLEGNSNFEQNSIEAMVNAIRHIFDPSADLGAINDRLRVKVEQARSLIRDGLIPRVRAIACNNGLKWNTDGQQSIDRAVLGDQVTWEHVNHDVLIGILQSIKPVDETLRLTGKAMVEDMNYSRVCVGRMPVAEVAALMKNHGEKLLERNIRRYLGLHGNRVNEGIRATLSSNTPENFYFFNNGITLVCDKFTYNALQQGDFQIKVKNLQIVNGGQSCMTILKTAEELEKNGQTLPAQASVLIRLYELSSDNDDVVLQITHATNSQNPVDLKDLRANDARQQQLEQSIQNLGYSYRRKRMDATTKATDITTGAAAEAVLAIWRKAPHQAKFLTREHFGKLYDTIFSESLNGAQVVIAALLYRIAENHRRRPHGDDPLFVRYASCFIAMQMGKRLLKALDIKLNGLDHRNFAQARQWIEEQGEAVFVVSRQDIDTALKALYGNQEISVQQLSATFRRGDLIGKLDQVEV